MIRQMTSKDILSVQHIAIQTWRTTYKNIIPVDVQHRFLEQSYSYNMLLKRMEKTLMLIAESDGVPIGFANVTYADEDGDAELTAMYILPTHQQTGYGQKLFQAALANLPEAKQLFVYVDNENVIGKNFYEKQGFELLSTFPEFLNDLPVETAEYVYQIPIAIS